MPTTQTRDTAFEETIKLALEGADMNQASDVIMITGKSGDAKTTLAAYFLGCELEYAMHTDGYRRKVRIKRCPDGMTPLELGDEETSHTTFPTAYMDISTKAVYEDFPGFFDNREGDKRLLTVIATQQGTQTTNSVKSIVITINYADFEEDKLIDLNDIFKVVARMFKERLPIHGEALRVMVTHLPERHHPKAFVMKRLRALERLVKDRLAKQPTEEDQGIEYYLSFLTKDGADKNVLLFDPLTDVTREEFHRTLENAPSFPASDLAFIAPEATKQEFMARIAPMLIQSTEVFDTLLNAPKKIEALKKEVLELTKLTEGFTTKVEEDEPVISNAYLEEVNRTIQQKGTKITEINATLTVLRSQHEQYRTEVMTIEGKTGLVSFHEITWDEKTVMGDMKKPIEYTEGIWFWKKTIRRPENSKVYVHTASWSGEPFAESEIMKATGGCEFGGSEGTYDLTGTQPDKGLFKITYTGPEKCSGGFCAKLKRKENEQPLNRVQLGNLTRLLQINERDESVLIAERSSLIISRDTLDTGYNNVLLARALNQANSVPLALKLKIEASETAKKDKLKAEAALTNLSALYDETLNEYHQNKTLYELLKKLDDVIHLNSSVWAKFRETYLTTLELLAKDVPNASEKPANTKPAQSEDFCFTDEPNVLCNAPETDYDRAIRTSFFNFIPFAEAANPVVCYPSMHLLGLGPTNVFAGPRPSLDDVEHRQSLDGYFGKIQNDPRTGVPVYPVHFFPVSRPAITEAMDTPFQPMRPLGQIKLYGAPHLCKSLDGSRTNIVGQRGLVPDEMMNPESIETVCEILPPTHWDAINGGAKQGLFRGVTNVVGAALCPKETSKFVKSFVQGLVHDTCYLTWRVQAHYAAGEQVEDSLYHAAADTFSMRSVRLACALVNEAGSQSSQKGFKKVGRLFSFFSQAAPLAYAAHQQGVVDLEARTINPEVLEDTFTYILTAGIAQQAVEQMAKPYLTL